MSDVQSSSELLLEGGEDEARLTMTEEESEEDREPDYDQKSEVWKEYFDQPPCGEPAICKFPGCGVEVKVWINKTGLTKLRLDATNCHRHLKQHNIKLKRMEARMADAIECPFCSKLYERNSLGWAPKKHFWSPACSATGFYEKPDGWSNSFREVAEGRKKIDIAVLSTHLQQTDAGIAKVYVVRAGGSGLTDIVYFGMAAKPGYNLTTRFKQHRFDGTFAKHGSIEWAEAWTNLSGENAAMLEALLILSTPLKKGSLINDHGEFRSLLHVKRDIKEQPLYSDTVRQLHAEAVQLLQNKWADLAWTLMDPLEDRTGHKKRGNETKPDLMARVEQLEKENKQLEEENIHLKEKTKEWKGRAWDFLRQVVGLRNRVDELTPHNSQNVASWSTETTPNL